MGPNWFQPTGCDRSQTNKALSGQRISQRSRSDSMSSNITENKTTNVEALQPGTPAPEFTLPSDPQKKTSLSEFRGRPVILAFYPADWSPVCGDQMALYNEVLPEFERLKAQLLGISVDGPWCH